MIPLDLANPLVGWLVCLRNYGRSQVGVIARRMIADHDVPGCPR